MFDSEGNHGDGGSRSDLRSDAPVPPPPWALGRASRHAPKLRWPITTSALHDRASHAHPLSRCGTRSPTRSAVVTSRDLRSGTNSPAGRSGDGLLRSAVSKAALTCGVAKRRGRSLINPAGITHIAEASGALTSGNEFRTSAVGARAASTLTTAMRCVHYA